MTSPNLAGTLRCAILILATSSAAALGQDDPAAIALPAGKGEESAPALFESIVDQSSWTASAEFMILDRIGGGNQTLIERVPLNENPLTASGPEVLNSNAFQQGFSGGPRLGLIRQGDNGCDLELSYFQIDGWNSTRGVGPDNPADWLIMRCPGDFTQTNQLLSTQVMQWQYATQLYNAECNVRWHPSDRVTTLAGFRWLNLSENLVGALEPPTISWEPPFWNTTTSNNLYGFQLGAAGIIGECGRFSLDGLVKAGIYDDSAEQTTAVSVIHKQVRSASAVANNAAFVGETGVQCQYQLTQRLFFKAGYEVMWLEGVALAPAQIPETYVLTSPKTVQALGVNCSSSVFYHGATVGLEYAF